MELLLVAATAATISGLCVRQAVKTANRATAQWLNGEVCTTQALPEPACWAIPAALAGFLALLVGALGALVACL